MQRERGIRGRRRWSAPGRVARTRRVCRMGPPCRTRRRRPMADVNAAMRDLDAGADDVQALLDEGKLIGFDISARPARRAAVRVLTRSVDLYWRTGRALSLDGPGLLKLILPDSRAFVPGTDLQRVLNCDASHISALIRAGHLRTVRGSRCGWGGSPMVTRASFAAFLTQRRIQ